MKNVVSISREDELLEAGSRWVLKIDAGEMSASDKASLDSWLDEDARHREVLLEVAAVWDKTDALARLAQLFPHGAGANREPDLPWPWRWAQGLGVAAGMAVLLISGLLFVNLVGNRALPTTSAAYTTAIGEQKTVLLPDGSEVVMNTNSRLSVTFTSSERMLRLARGEILVRVSEDRARPLSVVVGNRIIQAIGTEFLVEITDDRRVELMVTEGKVVIGVQPLAVTPHGGDVDTLDASVAPPALAQLGDNVVSAGEEVVLGADAVEPVKNTVSADEVEIRLSWKDGSLIFYSEPLEKALREVERYTTVEFVFLDESLKTRSISGRFRAGDVEALLLSLRLNFNITHEFDGKRRVLLSSL